MHGRLILERNVQVWLRQRGYQGYQDSLNSHLITLLVVYLTTSGGGRRCGSQMNVMQLFRVVMDSIGTPRPHPSAMLLFLSAYLYDLKGTLVAEFVVGRERCGQLSR